MKKKRPKFTRLRGPSPLTKKIPPAVKEHLPTPLERAMKILGQRAIIKRGGYWLDGQPISAFKLVHEANIYLKAHGLQMINLTRNY